MKVTNSSRGRLLAALAAGVLVAALASAGTASAAAPVGKASGAAKFSCRNGGFMCTEVYDPETVFGEGTYVGHDEPSLLFDSTRRVPVTRCSTAASSPRNRRPRTMPGQRSYDFQLYPAFWFGMAMCDTQSYPETVKTCIPDSDANISQPAAPYHAGTAFVELQFYPPGYVQQFDGFSCSATKWCVAMTIDSLSLEPGHRRAAEPAPARTRSSVARSTSTSRT